MQLTLRRPIAVVVLAFAAVGFARAARATNTAEAAVKAPAGSPLRCMQVQAMLAVALATKQNKMPVSFKVTCFTPNCTPVKKTCSVKSWRPSRT